MEINKEDITNESSKKYGLKDYAEHYQKGVQFVLDNWRGTYRNRATTIGLILPFCFTNTIGFSAVLLFFTGLGLGTEICYKRTKEHISQFGKLDDRFFIRTMNYDKNRAVIGYCQLQGMYLAAKEFGLEEKFFELKKKYTKNKVPNF